MHRFTWAGPALRTGRHAARPLARARRATRAALLPCAAVALLGIATSASAQDCLPLTPTSSQGAALMPGGLMNVRHGRFSARSDNAPGVELRPSLELDVYPHANDAVRPLALVLRGGKGTVGERSSYVGQLVETFADAGYVVATADYRSTSLDDGVADVTSALRLLTQCHAKALRVDQYKTVLVAEDSAAPVALKVAARLLDLRLGRSAMAPAAPAAVVIVGGRFTSAVAPVVPTRIVHGGSDSEVPLADARAVCAQSKAACEVVEVAGASHRAENWWPSQWGYKQATVKWLQSFVGAAAPAAWPPASRSGLRKRVVYDAANGLALDAWVPAGAGLHGAVVVVHGGGWEAGDRVTYATPLLRHAALQGLTWVSIDYRLTPGVTNREQVTDVKNALAWVRSHAADLRIDPQRIVLAGESASGQLVTLVAATEPGLRGVVSFYGVYDLEAMAGDPANPRSLARRLFRLTSLDDAARAQLRAHSPVHQASASLPAMLLIVGTADRLVEQQRAYAAALQAAGARVATFAGVRPVRGAVWTVEIPDAPHGMEAWHEVPHWRIWESRVGDWLRFVLREETR